MNLANILKAGAPENVLDAMYELKNRSRTHLGLSEIGHPCSRYLWYSYYKFEPDDGISGRILRLLELGNVIEAHLISDLMESGYVISDRQKEVCMSYDDIKIFGHLDGVITGVFESEKPHLLEIKTASEKYFNTLKKLGSYEKWSEKYKGQVQTYMLAASLKRALVLVYNKNTSEIYSERISLDKQYVLDKLNDVFLSLQCREIPDRKCPRRDWFEAKFCKFYGTCFK